MIGDSNCRIDFVHWHENQYSVLVQFMKSIIKAFYSFLPFKKEIYTVLKTVWNPPESLYKHLHFKDVFTVSIDNKRKFKVNHFGYIIENEIFWRGLTGGWEKESLKLWIKLCADSEIILDIGANTGIFSLVAKTVNPDSQVYAFEPHQMFFKMLQQNVSLNDFDIMCEDKAITNLNAEITIEDYSGEVHTIKVEGITLDKFIETKGLKKIDLIKIDAENSEPEIIEGFLTFLPLFKPTFLIEIVNNSVAAKVFGYVKELGYLYFNINEDGFIRQTDRIEKSDHFNYLLCRPEVARRLGLIKNDT